MLCRCFTKYIKGMKRTGAQLKVLLLVSVLRDNLLGAVEPAVEPVLYLLGQVQWAEVCPGLFGSLH